MRPAVRVPLTKTASAKVDIPDISAVSATFKAVEVTKPENLASLHLFPIIPKSYRPSEFGFKSEINSPDTLISSPVESPIPIVPPLNVAYR